MVRAGYPVCRSIHGMADDRVRVKVDGMDLISACANHMNPPLSYIDPSSVGNVKVYAGIAPVSVGGDSIGGTIQVNSQAPEFAREGQGTLVKGQAGVLYRSNGNAQGANLTDHDRQREFEHDVQRFDGEIRQLHGGSEFQGRRSGCNGQGLAGRKRSGFFVLPSPTISRSVLRCAMIIICSN